MHICKTIYKKQYTQGNSKISLHKFQLHKWNWGTARYTLWALKTQFSGSKSEHSKVLHLSPTATHL